MENEPELTKLRLRKNALAAAVDALPDSEHRDFIVSEFAGAYSTLVRYLLAKRGSKLANRNQNG